MRNAQNHTVHLRRFREDYIAVTAKCTSPNSLITAPNLQNPILFHLTSFHPFLLSTPIYRIVLYFFNLFSFPFFFLFDHQFLQFVDLLFFLGEK
ncbi:hypothetical protein L2E82_41966 [Cichorium intybus]|uniref:Uncharacterized protein n=1 Tax=Cichorium intybus TaxID=13427 RepID=A0ACB8ZLK5_CICIN|nr:hypothetical protein L2E82_41966 [Cichorium intybus]